MKNIDHNGREITFNDKANARELLQVIVDIGRANRGVAVLQFTLGAHAITASVRIEEIDGKPVMRGH